MVDESNGSESKRELRVHNGTRVSYRLSSANTRVDKIHLLNRRLLLSTFNSSGDDIDHKLPLFLRTVVIAMTAYYKGRYERLRVSG